MLLTSGEVFAGFTIERLLGQGGMGSVYLARHPRLPRQTALKLLNRELFTDKEVRARFEREADLAAQLDHPNIVAVYDRGTEDDQLWISMQYVDGVDAATVNPHNLPPERAVQIIEGVAEALDYAHGMGVLHRDVKPANIMLARGGHRERVFLTDFGIARLREDSTHLTQTGMFTATLAYASPEQMTGAHLDHRSDQYSLACALYWLLTGVAPFDAPAPAEIIRGHLQLAPPSAAALRQGLPAAMDAVIAVAMAKRPEHRFPSCAEFAAAARQALTAPTHAMPQYTPQPAPTMQAQQGSGGYPGSPLAYGAPLATSGPTNTAGPSTGAPQYGPSASGLQYGPSFGAGQQFPPTGYGAPVDSSSGQQFASVGQSGVTYPPNSGAGQAFSPSGPPPIGYGPNQGPGYQRPPGPPRRSNTALIVVISLVAVIALVVTGVVLAFAGDSDSPSSPSSTGKSTAAGTPTDPNALAKSFPKLVPQGVDTKYGIGSGPGYEGKTCFLDTSKTGGKPSSDDDAPAFPKWETAWNCWGVPIDQPDYLAVAFKTPEDAKAALLDLPSNTKATESNGGKSYTTYRWKKDGGGLPDGFVVVSFESDPARANYLLYASVTLTDSMPDSGFGLTMAKFKAWFTDLPL
ncbi:serine/threonine-protein kinase [Nocardia altamirensis]|uniref:serine/threonine-protein kinase n=1 Tax=Nocardia altamirensis TaxID=472158 RepID=UPI00083FDEB6|nr:serine/threonine-protein kinase [Nocardia altamirensis]